MPDFYNKRTTLNNRIFMKKILFLALVMLTALNLHAQLPNVRLQDVDGKTVQTGEISNDGNPIIISFWATWCKPCLRELKARRRL